jgi:hypothetical protein
VKTLEWRRLDRIREVRDRLWRYLSPASTAEETLLYASALLQMPEEEVLQLGRLQFLLSEEVGALLDHLPTLVRHLATTTAQLEEWSLERVRGTIQWSKTFALRAAVGAGHAYVTAPARRAYQTPENELLVFVLDAIETVARQLGWHETTTEEIGKTIAERYATAQRWRRVRPLLEVEPRPPSPRMVARIREGRQRRRYQSALEVYARYQSLVADMDRTAVRQAVEAHAVVTRDDSVLFELLCLFKLLDGLGLTGWRLSRIGLFGRAASFAAVRGSDERLQLWYQHTPRDLGGGGSRYRQIQLAHGFGGSELVPDIVVRRQIGGWDQWIILEAKLGLRRSLVDSARAALNDLLAYRRAFHATLQLNPGPVYGIGVAWGEGLFPEGSSEILLCSQDALPAALAIVMPSASAAVGDVRPDDLAAGA